MSSETIGAIDLHTHLLPHMDDGSKDTAMSLNCFGGRRNRV